MNFRSENLQTISKLPIIIRSKSDDYFKDGRAGCLDIRWAFHEKNRVSRMCRWSG